MKQKYAALIKHGRTGKGDPVYSAWQNMRQRCLNSNFHQYKDYGGRGIEICREWDSFVQFAKDMDPTWKKGLSLNRIDNDGPYCKDNCNWVTKGQQQRNTRKNTITWEQAKEIRELRKKGWLYRELATHFKTKMHVVADVLRGRGYAHF